MKRVIDVLTTANWQFSLGDIASCMATMEQLAQRGVPVRSVDEWNQVNTTIIGGGHVLGHMPQLQHFIVPGEHLLNAVGAHDTGEPFEYLKEYIYLSVRDDISRQIIGLDAELVPCPATLLKPSRLHRQMYGPRRPGHVVVHKDPVCERAIENRSLGGVLVVDPQPHRKVAWKSGGNMFDVVHDPRAIIAAMEGAHAVITRSLHLSIFALVAGVPFACIDTGDEPQSNKMRAYWKRAGIPEVMTDSANPIHRALELQSKLDGVRAAEITRSIQHCENMAKALQGRG